MKTTGIITEYNPFHNGHLYHLQKTKKITPNNYIICLMNGNFMQRGMPAVTDKWSRTKMALENGVDLVLELPLVYGIRSAEYFAEGSILTLASTGIVDSIVFGSEVGNIKSLTSIASILADEPEDFKEFLQKYVNSGLSFPAAREKALLDYYKFHYNGNNNFANIDDIKDIINNPNNILGIEYIKALQKHNLNIKPYTIKRKGAAYHSSSINNKVISASAIRKLIYSVKDNKQQIKNSVPGESWKYLEQDFCEGKIPLVTDHLGAIILNKLRQLSVKELSNYTTSGSGLERRIDEFAYLSGSLPELIDSIKTKAYTWTRIQRLLLHILFSLTKSDFRQIDKNGLQYLRILGFTRKGENMLAKIKKKSPLPLISQPADYLTAVDRNSEDPLIKMLSYDLLATDIYTLLYKNPEKRQGHLDFYTPVIKI